MVNEIGKAVENERPNPIQSPIAPVIPVADPVERKIQFDYHETGETPTNDIFEHFTFLKNLATTSLEEMNRFLRVHKSTIMWNNVAKAKREATEIGEKFANTLIAVTKFIDEKQVDDKGKEKKITVDDVREFIHSQIDEIKK